MRNQVSTSDTENRARKANLAKLLATENISVVHKNIPTAYFDVQNRVLGLPNWDNASKDVFDLLVGHEVGHALYTPNGVIEDFINEVDSANAGAVHSFINVIEDARIERKIKRKFAGLRKNFYNGYKELLERDFFGLKDRDILSFSLIDRINIHYKVGSLLDVPFFKHEKHWLKKIDKAESFDSVLDVVREIYNSESSETDDHITPDYGDDNADYDDDSGDNDGVANSKSDGSNDSDDDSGSQSAGADDTDENGDESISTGAGEETPDDGSDKSSDGRSGNATKPSGAETETNLTDAIADEFVDENSVESFYGTIPTLDADNYIRPLSGVHEELSQYYNCPRLIEETTEDYRKFKKSVTKTVNYLVKEFELKKNAEQLARASVSKTGVLDINKLHSYKFNEDLFKRVTTVPNGKNHGLVMFVDWSSSFADSIGSGLERIIEMVMFCRKINIPFDVYGFSDNSINRNYDETYEDRIARFSQQFDTGDLVISEFQLLHLLSSTVKTKKFDEQLRNVYGLSASFKESAYSVPRGFQLGGTPLNDTIVVANDILAKFRKKYGVEIINTVFVTDGDSNSVSGVKDENGNVSTFGSGSWYSPDSSILEDGITRKSYPIGNRVDLTNALLQSLSDRHNVNTIGYFIGNRPHDCVNAVQKHTNFDRWSDGYKPLVKKLNREKFISIEDHKGYTEFFIIKGGKDMDVDDDGFTVEEGASKRKMTTAFKKHTKSRLENRVMLSRFVELIA